MDDDRVTRVAADPAPRVDAPPEPDPSPQVDPSPEPPLAGRYRLLARIGRGGVADVHRAVDEVLGREVAVKLVRHDTPDPDALQRFAAETRTHAGLSHPNLVTVLDAGLAPQPDGGGGRPFLVMELIQGGTLADLATQPSEVVTAARIGADVAAGLAHVHERGVVHRDVKPANVLLGSDGRVALSDFGVARLLEADPGHTATGFTIGTAAYFAPEQVRGHALTPAADVYSLALVVLEVLTGRRAYPGPPAQAALARLQAAPEVPVGLPVVLAGLLRRMGAEDPAERPSAREVERTLRRLHATLSSEASRAVGDTPGRPRPAAVRTSIHPAPGTARTAPTPLTPPTARPRPTAPATGRTAPADPRTAAPARRWSPSLPSPVILAVLAVLVVIGAILASAVVEATRQADATPTADPQAWSMTEKPGHGSRPG